MFSVMTWRLYRNARFFLFPFLAFCHLSCCFCHLSYWGAESNITQQPHLPFLVFISSINVITQNDQWFSNLTRKKKKRKRKGWGTNVDWTNVGRGEWLMSTCRKCNQIIDGLIKKQLFLRGTNVDNILVKGGTNIDMAHMVGY